MADFVRTIIPNRASWPKFPTGLDSWGQSGKGQFRAMTQIGRTWEESYPPIKYDNANARKFFSYINQLFRNRTIFTISHYHLLTPVNTPIAGTIVVNGASQTGSTLNVTSTLDKILKHGDVISIAGLNPIYDITADMAAPNASSIAISPPIFAGGSPADTAVITITAVKFRAVLEEIQMPSADKNLVYVGLVLKFREVP